MPKLKRTSENQITKDTYDRGEDESRFPEEPDPGFGMTRADPDVIKRRKIRKASRKFAAPSSSAPPKAPAATNAFASTKLVANDAPSPSSNPFAKVQLNSGTTAPPSFSFGAAPKAEPKPFSFGPSTSQQQSSSKKSSLPSSKPTVKNTAEIEKINKNFFQMIRDHVDKGQICTNLSSLMDQYTNVAEQLEDDGGDGGNDDDDNNNGGSAFSGGSSNNDENNNSQPSSTSFSGFSFASSPHLLSSGATTFSFTGGSAPAPAATTMSNSSFSFGAQPATTSGGSSSNPIASEDDPTSNPDDGKLDIGQEENKDEETPYQVQARLVKLEGSGNTQAWKKLGTGVLRLYRNTITDKKRWCYEMELAKSCLTSELAKECHSKRSHGKQKRGKYGM
ncbi:hypothetical protein QTG54_008633 [Skeletonema marinoi]|uniref:Nuclear pore complex NUP2/50/61 domain-containing protein n=1 Tax=Skeletonema marinoi TaxID=267567 RepID=A0AAD8Y7D7_9STRA|nr:hypothetical protein QTG54_008633 [Skeletonema marinoi]